MVYFSSWFLPSLFMVKYPTIKTALIKYQYFFIACFSWRQSPLLGMLKIK